MQVARGGVHDDDAGQEALQRRYARRGDGLDVFLEPRGDEPWRCEEDGFHRLVAGGCGGAGVEVELSE